VTPTDPKERIKGDLMLISPDFLDRLMSDEVSDESNKLAHDSLLFLFFPLEKQRSKLRHRLE
jgi:hypothetical protein